MLRNIYFPIFVIKYVGANQNVTRVLSYYVTPTLVFTRNQLCHAGAGQCIRTLFSYYIK
jgi:hypothetical protein